MKKYGFGVDLGGTTVKIGLFEMTGNLVEKWEIPTDKTDNGKNVLDDITKAILGKLTERGISKDEVQGVGIDVPGPVLADGTVVKCVNIGWGIFNVEKTLEEKCKMPVKATNDANAAALGEMWKGGGEGHQDVVMVTLGTGVGGGVIVDGKIISGSNGAGGEIGHIPVNANETEACNCGNCGCLEQYASATGIARMARKKLAAVDTPSCLRDIKAEDLTAKDVCDAAKAKDALGMELLEELGETLGRALAMIAAVTNPEVFVIGGGVSKAGEILTETIEKYYTPAAFHACRNAKFALAKLGNDAGMYGCVKLLMD